MTPMLILAFFFIIKKPCELAGPTTTFAHRFRTQESMDLPLYPALTKIPSFSRWQPMSSWSTLALISSCRWSLHWTKAPATFISLVFTLERKLTTLYFFFLEFLLPLDAFNESINSYLYNLPLSYGSEFIYYLWKKIIFMASLNVCPPFLFRTTEPFFKFLLPWIDSQLVSFLYES